jgi:hypothetical protein
MAALRRRAVASAPLATSHKLGRAVALAGMLVAFRLVCSRISLGHSYFTTRLTTAFTVKPCTTIEKITTP